MSIALTESRPFEDTAAQRNNKASNGFVLEDLSENEDLTVEEYLKRLSDKCVAMLMQHAEGRINEFQKEAEKVRKKLKEQAAKWTGCRPCK